VNPCLALLVVCAAPDAESLQRLKRAAVSAAWELTPGATTAEEALAQIEERRAHMLVVLGPMADLVARVRERYPAMRIVSVGPMDGADVAVPSLEEVRAAVMPGTS
jgi:hypothetical protein